MRMKAGAVTDFRRPIFYFIFNLLPARSCFVLVMLKPPLHNEVYENKEQMKEKIWSAGAGSSAGRIKQITNLAWSLWTIWNETECRRVLLRRTSRNNLLLYFFFFVSSRTTQDKNGVSTWRDHQYTRVCCVTNLHSSRFVAYPSSLVLSQRVDCSDSSLTSEYLWY